MKRLLLAGLAGLCSVVQSSAVLITHRVTVQPIVVHSGTTSAHPTQELFEAETDKILSQAGIDVHFLPVVTITNSTYFNLSSNIQLPNSLHALAQSSGNGASSDPRVLNLWFVNSIDNNPGAIGFALQTSIPYGILRAKNGAAISKYAFTWGSGAGMRDIVAHELGHNLGLYHGMDESGTVQATGELNLMSRTGTFPLHCDHITPHGPALGQLNAFQKSRMLSVHTFVIPLAAGERYEYSPSTTPAPPSHLSATALSSSEIHLSWTDNSANEEGFRVYRSIDGIDFYEVASLPAGEVSYTDSGLSPNSEFTYEIVSFNGAGESAPIEATAVTLPVAPPPAPPLWPQSFLVALAGPQAISMSWDDSCDGESGFEIARSTDGSNFTVVALVPANSEFYLDTNLECSTIYYYKVRAFNAAGYSSYSNRSHTKTAPPADRPLWPTSFLVALTAPQTISMSWGDAATNEEGYEIERSTDGVNYAVVAVLPANSTFYSDEELDPFTIYYYRARAFNSSGYSYYSVPSRTRTWLCTPPATPTSFIVARTAPHAISMAWNDNATNEKGYQIERSTDGVNYTVVQTLGPDTDFYTDHNLAPSTIYYYRVRAFNDGGYSGYSGRSHTKTAR